MTAKERKAFEALRKSCKELLEHAEWMGTPPGYSSKDFGTLFEDAEKALALAEGKDTTK